MVILQYLGQGADFQALNNDDLSPIDIAKENNWELVHEALKRVW